MNKRNNISREKQNNISIKRNNISNTRNTIIKKKVLHVTKTGYVPLFLVCIVIILSVFDCSYCRESCFNVSGSMSFTCYAHFNYCTTYILTHLSKFLFCNTVTTVLLKHSNNAISQSY